VINRITLKRIKIELDEDVVNALISKKTVGKTYSDIVRALLKSKEKTQ
jgi:negative regulator of replication initiation